jgi:hypothetical protein
VLGVCQDRRGYVDTLPETLIVAAAVGLGVGYLIWGWPTDWYERRDVTQLPANPENDVIRHDTGPRAPISTFIPHYCEKRSGVNSLTTTSPRSTAVVINSKVKSKNAMELPRIKFVGMSSGL